MEGSTRLLQELGDGYRAVQDDHATIMRTAIAAGDGVEIRTEGDSFFAVFATPGDAVRTAVAAQRALAEHHWSFGRPLRVRMGMHTGEGVLGGDDYLGIDVNLAARIAAAAGGGQVLLSATTRSLVENALPDSVTLRDLGPHRLKDIEHAHRLHDLVIDGLPSDFPPPRTLEVPTNLPAERTSFVGRAEQVARVKELLRGPGLLTLTGPGGSGKTRLALHAGRQLLDEYPDGVFLADLAPILDPRLVPATIVDAVGVRAEGQRDIGEALRDHVRNREMLIVLDNFEQVMDASPVVADLLDGSFRLRILVTSREPLHIAGEQEYPVPPLSVPSAGSSADAVEAAEATALFLQRATAVDPGFRITEQNAATVAELCARLDGLPLAIELAASRVKMMPPRAILERLEHRLELLTGGPVDLPARQRTLREAIAWSHDLLDEAERTLFRRLTVFAGGWTIEAAEAVGGLAPDAADVLGILGSLMDKSLVTRASVSADEVRLGMLETIREFGAEQLRVAGEGEASRDRHATFFLSLAERAEPHLRGIDQKRWLDQLETEHDNFRAALRHAIDAGDAMTGLRLVAALWRFWHLHSHLADGRRWAEEVLALPAAAARTAERAKGLTALGGLAYWQEDVPAFRRAYEEALSIARELGDPAAEAEGVYNLSFAPAMEGDIETAVELLEQSRAMFEQLGNRRGVGDSLFILGIIARLRGELAGSRELAEESLRIHRAADDRFGTTIALYARGRSAFEQGDLVTAESSYLEALDNDEQVGSRTGIALILENLAAQAGARGDHLRALRLSGASEAIKEAAGGQAPPPLIDLPDPREAAGESLAEEVVKAAWEEGRAMTLEDALAYAREVGE
ncbi:MAG: AAA family ATPase [Actinomycetota bacterium]|nr:AAA family ATPase [Actinomycetota bacterium]